MARRPDASDGTAPAGRGGVLALSLLVVAVAVSASIAFFPFAPNLPADGLDPGWMLGMNHAVQARMAMGRDIIFTMGPYVFVYTKLYAPDLRGLHIFASAVVVLAYVAALMALIARSGRPALAGALGLLITVLLIPMSADGALQCIPVFYLFLSCARVERDTWRAVALGLLVVAMAILSLAKGSFAMASIVVLFSGAVAQAGPGRMRHASLPVMLYLLAVPALWGLAGQRLSDLPNFVLQLVEVVRGYSNGMALPGPLWRIGAYAAGVAVVLAVNRWRFHRNRPDIALLLGAGALLFLAFKGGFVRHDAHAIMAAEVLVVTACVFVITGASRRLPWLGLGAAAGVWLAIGADIVAAPVSRVVAAAPSLIQQRVAHSAMGLRLWNRVDLYDENALARIRRESPLPPIQGTADIYSFGQSALLANRIAWSPRPMFQSLTAYTPRLAALNAAHLLGPRAPDVVFFQIEPLDGSLPALEDGLSWPILLSRYALTQRVGRMAMLQRRPDGQVVPVTTAPINIQQYRLGEAVPLPHEPSWARVDIRPTLLGRLASLLFRAPILQIVLEFPDGRRVQHRFVSDVASAGFLISPYVATTDDFIGLYTQASYFSPEQRPTSFRVEATELRGLQDVFWQSRFSVALQAVTLPTQDVDPSFFGQPPAFVAASPEPAATGHACALDLLNGSPVQRDAPRSGRVLSLNGWGHLEAPRRHAAASRSLRLTGPDGTVLRAPVEPVLRPDVAEHFGDPALGNTGFSARLDMQGLAGAYTLDLELVSPEGREVCRLLAAPLQIVP